MNKISPDNAMINNVKNYPNGKNPIYDNDSNHNATIAPNERIKKVMLDYINKPSEALRIASESLRTDGPATAQSAARDDARGLPEAIVDPPILPGQLPLPKMNTLQDNIKIRTENIAVREQGNKPIFLLQLYSYSGVEESTLTSLILELARGKCGFSRIGNDALISRSRSRGVSNYYNDKNYGPGTAVVLIDHDMEWRPGDAFNLAKLAIEKDAIVGGLYSKRAEGKGFSSRFKGNPGNVAFGKPGLIEADYVATGFMAIPWTVLDKIIKESSIVKVTDGRDIEYYPLFATMITSHTVFDDEYEFLSEDWSFCKRAEEVGVKSYISTEPIITHWGLKGYKLQDAVSGDDISKINKTDGANDSSNISPDYYSNGIEVRDFINSHDLGFDAGNIIKYIVRYDKKHKTADKQLEDLMKAMNYLNNMIKNWKTRKSDK